VVQSQLVVLVPRPHDMMEGDKGGADMRQEMGLVQECGRRLH
jgi:hypothetical protein